MKKHFRLHLQLCAAKFFTANQSFHACGCAVTSQVGKKRRENRKRSINIQISGKPSAREKLSMGFQFSCISSVDRRSHKRDNFPSCIQFKLQ